MTFESSNDSLFNASIVLYLQETVAPVVSALTLRLYITSLSLLYCSRIQNQYSRYIKK